jgi:hypothetical protein
MSGRSRKPQSRPIEQNVIEPTIPPVRIISQEEKTIIDKARNILEETQKLEDIFYTTQNTNSFGPRKKKRSKKRSKKGLRK